MQRDHVQRFQSTQTRPSGRGNSLLFLSAASLKASLLSLGVQSAPHLSSPQTRPQLLPASSSSSTQGGVTESKLHFILRALAHFRDALAALLLLMCFTSFCHSCFAPSKLLLRKEKNPFFVLLEWDFSSPHQAQFYSFSMQVRGF